jgi:sugar lactone lactonase YvrE
VTVRDIAAFLAATKLVVGSSSASLAAPYKVASATTRLERVPLPAGLAFPNGVATSSDGSLYVGGVTSGYIWRRDVSGEWRVFYRGSADVYAVTSLRLDEARGVLWGASPDAGAVLGVEAGRAPRPHRVFAIDLRTGALLASVVAPEGGFGNDLVPDGRGGAYITDSRLGCVWQLDADLKRWTVAATHPLLTPSSGIGPAGIARMPGGDLIVGLFGKGEVVRIHAPGPTSRVDRVDVKHRLIRPDGMSVVDESTVLLTVGGSGEVLLLDVRTGRARVVATGLRGPVNVDVAGAVAHVTESGIVDPAMFDPSRPDPTAMSVVRLQLESVK